MSRGKYSPNLPTHKLSHSDFKYNCYGKEPEPWTQEIYDSGVQYDEKTMYDSYDAEGYDSYGYSAFDANGNFVGSGNGVDRNGFTEMDYLTLQDIPEEHRDSYYYYNS
jgi:hypothetical protein